MSTYTNERKSPGIPESAFIAKGAIVKGDVTLGENCSVWYHATVRADRATITIGDNTNIQDNCVVHVDAGASVHIGNGVTVGHSAIVHGCTVGDNTLVGMGAILLNDCVIGKNCMIGAGTLVTQNTRIPDNSLVLGNPGKVKRTLTAEEIEANRRNAMHYVEEGQNCKEEYKSY